MHRTAQGIYADIAASFSGGVVVTSWVTEANDILQLGATLVAIVAGIYAIRWHRTKIKIAKERFENEQSNR